MASRSAEWLVDRRNGGSGLRSDFGQLANSQRSQVHEQWQAARPPKRERQTRAGQASGTTRKYSSGSATGPRHADRRARQRALARRADRLRSDGRPPTRSRPSASPACMPVSPTPELARSNTRDQVSFRSIQEFPRRGTGPDRRLQPRERLTQVWQGQIGGDIITSIGGVLSLDVVGHAKDGVITSIFNGTCAVLTKGPSRVRPDASTASRNSINADDLKATLSNNTGFLLLLQVHVGCSSICSRAMEYFRQGQPER